MSEMNEVSLQTRELLFEIGSEELPSEALIRARSQLVGLVDKALAQAGLSHGEITIYSTPRRLAVYVSDLVDKTERIHRFVRGAACTIAFDETGAFTKAAHGFAHKHGVEVDKLVRRKDTDGREYVYAEIDEPSRPTLHILPALLQDVMTQVSWLRSQRWGSTSVRWCRPVRWICCLFGDEIVPVMFGDIQAGNMTAGHRILAPGFHRVSCAEAYLETLRRAYVYDALEREQIIRDGIARLEHDGLSVSTPKRVFDEVVNLTEYPSVLMGSFDESFLKVPHEIICESMLSHQRYFPIYDANNELTCKFVIVSNVSPTLADTVIAGNERVVRARLADAQFFYEEDLMHPLEAYLPRLADVVFQEKLGTMLEKAERMENLATEIARQVGLSAPDAADAARAARLAKADLVTQAVVEFTSQQGIMGGYYAAAAGEHDAVSRAIRDQYRPHFSGDSLPEGAISCCVAIADKLDTICGMFAIGEPPTGSSDPFAQRRGAIGIIAILRTLEGVRLSDLIDYSLACYADQGLVCDSHEVAKRIHAFFSGRLATIAKDEGVSYDVVEAVQAVDIIDPVEFLKRCHALMDVRASNPELFCDLATAYTRAAHLSDPKLGTDVDVSLCGDAETALLSACERVQEDVTASLNEGRYRDALVCLASLRLPIDRFFEDVLVMDTEETLRKNRLRLLNRFSEVFAEIADIGALADQ